MKKEFETTATTFLLDTNIVILALARQEPEQTLLRIIGRAKKLKLSPIVIAEFLIGADANEQEALNILVDEFGFFPIDETTAHLAAFYRRKLTRKSVAYLLDCFIAASCKQHNLVLITNNKKDFPMTDIKIFNPQEILNLIR